MKSPAQMIKEVQAGRSPAKVIGDSVTEAKEPTDEYIGSVQLFTFSRDDHRAYAGADPFDEDMGMEDEGPLISKPFFMPKLEGAGTTKFVMIYSREGVTIEPTEEDEPSFVARNASRMDSFNPKRATLDDLERIGFEEI